MFIGQMTYQGLLQAAHRRLPKGGDLPAEEWEHRHRTMTRLLWVAAAGIALYSALDGYPVWHTGVDVSGIVLAALIAARPRYGRRARTLACAFGLLTAAAMGIHVAGGVTEAHFSFFVVVVLLTLYEDWTVLGWRSSTRCFTTECWARSPPGRSSPVITGAPGNGRRSTRSSSGRRARRPSGRGA